MVFDNASAQIPEEGRMMADQTPFQYLMRQTDVPLTNYRMAKALGIGKQYASALWNGRRPISGSIRKKIDALIAAKGNGPAKPKGHTIETASSDSYSGPLPEMVEQVEVDLQKIIDEADDSVEPANPVFAPIIGTGFRVEGVPGGGYRITQTVAECLDQAFARVICDLLNKEAG